MSRLKTVVMTLSVLVLAPALFGVGFYTGRVTKKIPHMHENNMWYINKIMSYVPMDPLNKKPNLLLADPTHKEPYYKLQPKLFKED